ncbi:LacI family DNA-binding transcriptional regulator [Xanthovirga aplysinae]|uniref:LacI family DNA-binding transcriptional regulator n=1 Tax=Xanthovirga aplysinae TaxID=2529853 RepID=UPI0012BBE2BD|nr:LacI family DNA-binding transcriptional regulator [Xanthovirga aplysinae]MTI30379.1 LacI family transcriptional regulator [Xanthovirga aplysinae]
MKHGQITIKDIARKLSISPSTVSRALKNHPDISKKTKKKVQELAKELDYRPNSVALSLRSSKTYTIGVIIPEIAHHFFSTVISGIEHIAYKNGYKVVICQSNESYNRELMNTQAMLSSRVDGLLVSLSKETNDYEHLKDIQRRNIPLVFFDRICKELETSRIVIDDFEGAFQAVEHLIQQGCKRIAHLTGPTNLSISMDRLSGYKAALQKYNIPIDEDLVIKTDLNPQSGEENTKKLINLPKPPDGVFAVTDPVALGVLKACKKLNVKVPDEISIIGFAGEPLTELTEPQISTIGQPGFEIGQLAAQEFLRQLEEGENFIPETKTLNSKLIVRESSRRA